MSAGLTALPFLLASGCFQDGQNLLDQPNLLTSGLNSGASPSSSPTSLPSVGPLAISSTPFSVFTTNSGSSVGQLGGILDTQTSLNTALGGAVSANTIFAGIETSNASSVGSQGQRPVTLRAAGGLGVSGISALRNYISIYGSGLYSVHKWSILIPGFSAPFQPAPTQPMMVQFYNRTAFTSFHHSSGHIILAGGTVPGTSTGIGEIVVIPISPNMLNPVPTIVSNIISSPNIFAPRVGQVSPAMATYMTSNCNISMTAGWLLIAHKSNSTTIDRLIFVSPATWAVNSSATISTSTTGNCSLSNTTFSGLYLPVLAGSNATGSQVSISGGPNAAPTMLPNVASPLFTWSIQNNSSSTILVNSIGPSLGSGYSASYYQQVNSCGGYLQPGSICQYVASFSGSTVGAYTGNLVVTYTAVGTVTQSTQVTLNGSVSGSGSSSSGSGSSSSGSSSSGSGSSSSSSGGTSSSSGAGPNGGPVMFISWSYPLAENINTAQNTPMNYSYIESGSPSFGYVEEAASVRAVGQTFTLRNCPTGTGTVQVTSNPGIGYFQRVTTVLNTVCLEGQTIDQTHNNCNAMVRFSCNYTGSPIAGFANCPTSPAGGTIAVTGQIKVCYSDGINNTTGPVFEVSRGLVGLIEIP